MKIFISCSSSEEISDEYKIVTKYLNKKLSKNNYLVFGSVNRGLMGICYHEFLKNNRNIIGICYEMYKDEIKDLKLDEVYMVNTLEESNRVLQQKSDIIIVLPGSYGTLSEFINILEEKRTKLHDKEIILFNINGFYNDMINMFSKIYNNISPKYDFNSLCKVFNTVDDIIKYINQ